MNTVTVTCDRCGRACHVDHWRWGYHQAIRTAAFTYYDLCPKCHAFIDAEIRSPAVLT